MCEERNAILALLALDVLDVAQHAVLREAAGQHLSAKAIQMEPGQGDELEHKPVGTELVAEVLDLVIGHPGSVPVERGRQVVCHEGLGVGRLHALGEGLRLGSNGLRGLHPANVAVLDELAGTGDGHVNAALAAVVTLASTGEVPVEVEVLPKDFLGCSTHAIETLAGPGDLVHERLDRALLVGNRARLDFLREELLEAHQVRRCDPLLFRLRALGGGVAQRGIHLDGGAEDEAVVQRVDVAVEEVRGLGVGPAHDHVGGAHDVHRQPGGAEAIAVLLRGHQDLPAHVAALLGPWLLVLIVHTRSPGLDEQLGQLHHRREPPVSRIRVGDTGPQVVHRGGGRALLSRHAHALLLLPAVVEALGAGELVDLLGHCVHGIVCEVGSGLVGGTGRRRALPAGDVDCLQAWGHGDHLHRVQSAEGVGVLALLPELLEHPPCLLGHRVAVVGLPALLRAPHRRHRCGVVGALLALEAGQVEEGLHLSDVFLPLGGFGHVCGWG
eukprot:471760_1